MLLRIAAFTYLGKLFGTNMSSRMVEWGSTSLPIMLGFMLVPVAAGVITFIPETLDLQGFDQPLPTNVARSVSSHFSICVLFLCCSLRKPMDAGVGLRLSEYMERQLNWSTSDARCLQTVRLSVELFVFLLLMPMVLFIMQSSRTSLEFSASKIDLRLAQVSAFFLASGSFLMVVPVVGSFIAGIGVYTLGRCFVWLCYSVLLSHISRHATLFAVVHVFEAGTFLATSDGMQLLFDIAKQKHGIASGLPYIVLGAVCSLAFVLLLCTRTGSLGQENEEQIMMPPHARFNIRARMSRAASIIVHMQ